jgi:hypothetical protein
LEVQGVRGVHRRGVHRRRFIEGGFGSSKIREVKFIVKKVNLYELALITK